jgi:cytochrome c553
VNNSLHVAPALALVLLAGHAASAPPAKKEASAPTSVCASCHGAHGEGAPASQAPRLAGQAAEYLKKQLDDYASGTRENPIMSNFAKPLNEAQRWDIATRFSALSSPSVPETTPATPRQLARGHQLAYQGDESRQAQACNSCHGPDGAGVLQAAPYLAGQSAEYLQVALRAFQLGTRQNDAGELMRSVVKRLTDEDIAAVSVYFAHATPTTTPSSSR